jgi:putative membrane protein
MFWPRRNAAVLYCLTTYGWASPWAGAWPVLWVALALKLALWALIVTALIFAVRWFRRQNPPGHGSTPLEILRARYARGELSRQEFEAMRQDLEH